MSVVVIVVVIVLIIAVIGGIAFFVLKQDQSKGSLGEKLELVNQPLLLEADETKCISPNKAGNAVILDTFIDTSGVEESENVKKVNNDHQMWTSTAKDQIKRKGLNFCLDIAGGQFKEGAKIIQTPCSDAVTQKWTAGNGQLKSKLKPNFCMGVNTIEINQQLELQACSASANQKWTTQSDEE